MNLIEVPKFAKINIFFLIDEYWNPDVAIDFDILAPFFFSLLSFFSFVIQRFFLFSIHIIDDVSKIVFWFFSLPFV
jgi:hypothetical protein